MKKRTSPNKNRSFRKIKNSKRVNSFKMKRTKTQNKSRKKIKFSKRKIKRKSKSKMKGGSVRSGRHTTARIDLPPRAGRVPQPSTFAARLDNIRTKDNKILIMGAGPVGLFAAYYLLKHYPDTHIVLGELRKVYNRNQVINIGPTIISRKNAAGQYVIDDQLLTEFIIFGCKHYKPPLSFIFSDKQPSIPDRDSSLARLLRNPIRDISSDLPPNFRGPDQSTQIPFTGDQTRCVEPKHEGKSMEEMRAYYREEGNNLSLSAPINAIQMFLTRLLGNQRYSDRFDFFDFYDISKEEGYEIPQIIDMLSDLKFPIIIPALGIQRPTVSDQPQVGQPQVGQPQVGQGGGALDISRPSGAPRGAGANRAREEARVRGREEAAPRRRATARRRALAARRRRVESGAIENSLDSLCGTNKFRQNIKAYDWREGRDLDNATKPKLKYGFITTVKLKPGSAKSFEGGNMLTENKIKELLKQGWQNLPGLGATGGVAPEYSEMYGCYNPGGFCYHFDEDLDPDNQSYARLFPKNKKLKEKVYREGMQSLGREYISPHSGELYLGIVSTWSNMNVGDLKIRFVDALLRYGISFDSIQSFHGGSFETMVAHQGGELPGRVDGFPIVKYKPDLKELPIVLEPKALKPLVFSVNSEEQNKTQMPLRQIIEAMEKKETVVYFIGDALYPHHFFTGSGVGIGFIETSLIIDFLQDFKEGIKDRIGRLERVSELKENLHAGLEELWHSSHEITNTIAHAYGQDQDTLLLPLITKAVIDRGSEAYQRSNAQRLGRQLTPSEMEEYDVIFKTLQKSGQIPVYGEKSEYSEEGIYTNEPLLDSGIDQESVYRAEERINVTPAEYRGNIQWYKVIWTDKNEETFTTYRRYSDFKWLRESGEGARLQDRRVQAIPFPEEKIFHSNTLALERAIQLQDFLSSLFLIVDPNNERNSLSFKFLTQDNWENHEGAIGYDSLK